MDFAKPVKAITLPQDVLSTSDRHLIELKNQVQLLMEDHLAPTQPTQVNKITTSCEIYNGPHDTQYCMEDSKQAFVEYTSLRTDEVGGKCMAKEEKKEREGDPKDTNTIAYIKEQRDTPLLERKDIAVVGNLGSNKDDEGIKWLDVKEPLDLVDTSKESVYESLIKEIPNCLLNYDFRIKKGDPRNLKIPCVIGHKFIANTYVDVDLPMSIMSLAYYKYIRKNRYKYRGRKFVGLGRYMHVSVENMSYIIDFAILENIETNIELSLSHVIFGRPFIEIVCLAINKKHGLMTFTDETKEITFKTPYKEPERSELSSEGHDLISSRVILSEEDYDRGCRKPSDLEDGFYKDNMKLEPEYLTRMNDEGEVT
nr:protein kinase-like domain, concanavalin A-like lectin/glucanase domain protein [Tanacetum cinerariifolium]